MLDKLHSYYKNSLLLSEKPNSSFYSHYHWFKEENSTSWLGIPLESIHNQELELLKTLFQYEYNTKSTNTIEKKWHDFLFSSGMIPEADFESYYRFIQFQLYGSEWEQNDIEEAMYGFFHDNSIVIWKDRASGVIIEQNPDQSINVELLRSLSQTLESDFFLKAFFYCGKVQALSIESPILFKEEKHFFENAIQLMPSDRVYTFEKCFPYLLSAQLPKNMQEWMSSQLLQIIADEPELLTAVKRFLENNSNATLTAKQLYVHRNTLQYRLDKFMQKTGINLKDFNSSITVYLACLLNSQ
ncbi:helix-turn-helix domain-containing protein [Bacillus sp. FJAT-49705]|uniref:Helix-turn-helix domain-containing protein n=1 Tax=Cytobacillus citreus TaxID=2833586 RepID=A0ABS5NX76_9BACI|nr:helix-turn-helix domain-containing protein [Cytobacillus citreus]MBS4192447.1 helix-turn-helix domain-containing protein [Cytobacillus citreus]